MKIMDIKSFLPCKKPRRSGRLEVKEKILGTVKFEALIHGPLGYFEVLPLELRFFILRYLAIDELSILTITSKAFRNLIEGFRVISSVGRNIIPKTTLHHPLLLETQFDCLAKFKQLGLLIKRSTCLYATKERLKFLADFLTKLMCCNTDQCQDSTRCISLTCYGKFLHTVISGWDDSECQRVYECICQHTCIMKQLKIILNSENGVHMKREYDTRVFFRRVFLDQCSTVQDKAFWLSRILKPWAMVQQARILYILYGPTLDGYILWYEMCENTPTTTDQISKYFGELTNAIQILYQYKKEWSEDNVISIIDELTCSPDEWLAENVAHLLILSGDVISSKLLISKAINGRMIELSSITTSFCLVCVKNCFSLTYVTAIIQKIVEVMDNTKDRWNFINGIVDMFKELILDLHELSEPEDGQNTDMYFMVTAMSEFTKKMLQLAFKNMLS